MSWQEHTDRGKGFCEFLGEYTMNIINFKKKKMKLLTKEQREWYENVKIYYVCNEKFDCHYTEEYRGAAHSIRNLKYSVPKKIPAVFHNGSSYDYSFIIKEFSEELEKQFPCLGLNTEKDIIFIFLIKKTLQEL